MGLLCLDVNMAEELAFELWGLIDFHSLFIHRSHLYTAYIILLDSAEYVPKSAPRPSEPVSRPHYSAVP